uniref:Uncharacterized protein n=1 Tax=Amphimedon queenslandica TaxID=400682 RepID=A0A1X7VXD2_AMPQE
MLVYPYEPQTSHKQMTHSVGSSERQWQRSDYKPLIRLTPDEWPKLRKRSEQFRIASGLSEAAAAKQVNTLQYCMEDEFDVILDSMKVTEDERGDYTVVLRKFDDFFKVRCNVFFKKSPVQLSLSTGRGVDRGVHYGALQVGGKQRLWGISRSNDLVVAWHQKPTVI